YITDPLRWHCTKWSCGDSSSRSIFKDGQVKRRDVCFWHLADIRTVAANVRFRWKRTPGLSLRLLAYLAITLVGVPDGQTHQFTRCQTSAVFASSKKKEIAPPALKPKTRLER